MRERPRVRMNDLPCTPGARIVLVGGGARSGKSTFALARARRLGRRRAFLATGQAFDQEMTDRIAAHVRTRGADFRTIEAPLALPEALLELRDVDVVVIDCLTLWLSNLLLRQPPAADVAADVSARVGALAAALQRRAFHAVVVTNEVGMGLVPETALGRQFRDLAGIAHQRLAGIADEIHLAVMGTVLRLRPEPVSIQPPEDQPPPNPDGEESAS
jgi:adenosylcobinamide kinase/adenosylcobinamide-phosphate guanylyltransferase